MEWEIVFPVLGFLYTFTLRLSSLSLSFALSLSSFSPFFTTICFHFSLLQILSPLFSHSSVLDPQAVRAERTFFSLAHKFISAVKRGSRETEVTFSPQLIKLSLNSAELNSKSFIVFTPQVKLNPTRVRVAE